MTNRTIACGFLLVLIGIAIFTSNIFMLSSISNKSLSAFATAAGENGKIAFISNRDDSNWEIYVMNTADGSDVTRLTNNRFFDVDPAWSPDGTKIAFRTERDGAGIPYSNAEIYVMNADGSNPTRLTNNPYFDAEPSWSPDGTKIAFSTGRDGGIGEIYVMNADGSNPTRLTNNPFAHETAPDWSPDGTKIAFQREGQIWVMNAADGGGQKRLTTIGGTHPSWSPDGTRIAFSANDEIYVMNADGSNPTRLTNARFSDIQPTWSPDGTKIAFDSVRDGNDEIYVMNADGSEQINLSNNPALDGDPDWSPTSTPIPPEDTTPPVLTVPEDMIVEATTANDGTLVTFTVTAEDNVDGTATLEEDGTTITQDDVGGEITISCEPSSGSEFPIGDTEVECTATDEAGNVGGPESFTITVNPPPRPTTTCEGETATIVGTAGDDTNIVGTSDPDVIAARGGNDRIRALGGNDLVCGGAGHDLIEGGAGADRLFGDDPNREGGSSSGSGGTDNILGGTGNDFINGGPGSDRLDGYTDSDVIFGSSGNDALFGSTGNDRLFGGNNNDRLDGGTGTTDSGNGGAGFDRCVRLDTVTNCEG